MATLLQASSEREKQLAAQAAKAGEQVSKAKKRGKQVKTREAATAAAAHKRLQQRQAKAKQSRDDAAAARLSTAGLARAFVDTGIPARQEEVCFCGALCGVSVLPDTSGLCWIWSSLAPDPAERWLLDEPHCLVWHRA